VLPVLAAAPLLPACRSWWSVCTRGGRRTCGNPVLPVAAARSLLPLQVAGGLGAHWRLRVHLARSQV
jgi:hypothetical protein